MHVRAGTRFKPQPCLMNKIEFSISNSNNIHITDNSIKSGKSYVQEKMVKNLKEYMEIQDSGNKVLKALNAVISSSTRLLSVPSFGSVCEKALIRIRFFRLRQIRYGYNGMCLLQTLIRGLSEPGSRQSQSLYFKETSNSNVQ